MVIRLINEGRKARMQDTSYDPSVFANSFQTATSLAGQMIKNHFVQNDATSIVYNIFAVIPMCVLHDFFDNLPIARGLTVRLNLYFNTGIQITETFATSNHIAITSSVILRASCPFQVSSICNDPTTGSGFSVSTAINYSPICLENRMFNVTKLPLLREHVSFYSSNRIDGHKFSRTNYSLQ